MTDSNKILLISESRKLVSRLQELARRFGVVEKATSGYDALQMVTLDPFDLILLDFDLSLMSGLETLKHLRQEAPTVPILVVPRQYMFVTDVARALEYNAQSYLDPAEQNEDLEKHVESFLELGELPRRISTFRKDLPKHFTVDRFIGSSAQMYYIYQRLDKAANSDVSVLIRGESGTGKELIARMLHALSSRVEQRFVALNCAAIPENLLESELFGHEKGAFTGAMEQRKGKFEISDRGTLFLDEIGDMSPVLQAKLLRALEYGEFERVGGNESIATDVRILSASNKNLEQEIEKGNFREDLYYRLNVYPIEIPPLRERKGDIPLLAIYFASRFNRKNNQSVEYFDAEVVPLLKKYSWPGNVRELQNVMEQASLLADENTITTAHFPSLPVENLQESDTAIQDHTIDSLTDLLRSDMVIPIDKLEAAAIHNAIRITGGNVSQAAEQLGVSRVTLYRKIEKYNLKMEE